MSRTPYGAARDFAGVIQEALNVLAVAKVTLSPASPGHVFGLTVNRDQGIAQAALRLQVRLTVQALQEHGEWSIQTRGYQYGLTAITRGREIEVFQYHWDASSPPHIHVSGGKEHIPTGRILLEAVIEHCILERGWQPRHDQWEETLTATRGHFQVNRHWD